MRRLPFILGRPNSRQLLRSSRKTPRGNYRKENQEHKGQGMRKVWIHRFVPYLTVFCIGIIISVLLFGPAVAAQGAGAIRASKGPDPAMWRGDVTAVDAEYLKAYHEEWTAITLQKSYLKAEFLSWVKRMTLNRRVSPVSAIS